MKGDLFNDVVEPGVHVGGRSSYSVSLSIVTHVLLVGALLIVPFVGNHVFPTPQSALAFTIPPAVPVPPKSVVELTPVPAAVVEALRPDAAPLEAPTTVTEPPPAIVPMPAGTHALPGVRASGDIALSAPASAPRIDAPVADVPAPAVPRDPIPVGGAVEAPRKVHHVAPLYPAIARASRQQGTVTLEATIAKDGRVTNARVLRSNALFDQAAIDAVRQWRYTVPTLNGIPVDVIMTVTVTFSLGR